MHAHLIDAIHKAHPYLLQSLGFRATANEGAVAIGAFFALLIVAAIGAALRRGSRG